MCGIAGILRLNKNIQLKYKPKVLEVLKHRGPDAQRYYAFEDAIFYHTRLSIIDLSSQSHQPFFLNEKKCIVFNGEIFNYKELSGQLDNIQTSGDVEVLIKHFDKYKVNGLHQLNGFFAFAYYDDIQKELYLVRDRYGEKPLYYYYDEDVFAFASEIFPLLHLIQKKLPINYDALYTYFRLHYIAGEDSILKGIKRLLPGHYLHIYNNQIQVQKWYYFNSFDKDDDFKSILESAVEKRLVSDAPIGAFLSGGVDSSIICAIAKQFKTDLHTFSLGYKNESLYNETNDALKVARYIGSIHHNFEITTDEVIEHLNEILLNIDEPFADSSAINVYFLTSKIKPYATVALSGDGADELWMGYNKHKIFLLKTFPVIKLLALLINPILSVIPDSRSIKFLNNIRKIKKFSKASQLSPLKKYIYLSEWTTDTYIHQLFNRRLNNHYFYSLFDKYKQLSEIEIFNKADIDIVLSYDMLYKTDYFGMLNAVEIRSPYLDHRVVEWALQTSFDNKIHYTQQKYLLKKTFSHLLPESVFQKKKSGFEIPLHKILSDKIQGYSYLEKDFIYEQKLFNYNQVAKLINNLPKNMDDAALKLWAIIVFQHWYNKFEPFIDKNI